MVTTTVHIPDEILLHVTHIVDELGFETKEEFFQEAIRDKVLELQKKIFFRGSNKIAEQLRRKKISEKEILYDFSQKKHQ